MSTESERPTDRPDRLARGHRRLTRLVPWLPPMSTGAVGVGLVVVAFVADGLDQPEAPGALVVVGLVVGSLLVALAVATRMLVVRSASQWLSVFPARRVFRAGAGLVALAGGFVASLVWRHPFEYVFSRFRIGAPDVADAGLLVAAVICLVSAGVAFFGAWDARCDERSWAEAGRRR